VAEKPYKAHNEGVDSILWLLDQGGWRMAGRLVGG